MDYYTPEQLLPYAAWELWEIVRLALGIAAGITIARWVRKLGDA